MFVENPNLKNCFTWRILDNNITFFRLIDESGKVELARLECERERRHRELEARLEAQRQMEASRNNAALQRALAPPLRPTGRRPMFRFLETQFIYIPVLT